MARTVCVIGLGTMGSQIAVVFARSGFVTRVVEADAVCFERGMERIEKFLSGRVKKGKLTESEAESTLSNIRVTQEIGEGARDAEFALEAVFEDMAAKKEVFEELGRTAPADCVLASNTSTLSVTALAAASGRPSMCVGAHFLIPAALTPLVEVVRGLESSEETVRRTVDILSECGKDTVVVNDAPAFVLNRLYIPLLNEAFFALGEDVAGAAEIDAACRMGLGMPLGPLSAADASGLDVVLSCVETLHRELGDKYRPAPLLVKLVRAGHLGRKSGRGVFEYEKGQKAVKP